MANPLADSFVHREPASLRGQSACPAADWNYSDLHATSVNRRQISRQITRPSSRQVFLSAGWRKKVTPVAKCTRDRSIPAVFGGGARQSVGRQVADCNGATKKKTTKERRKCPGTRYRPGQIRFPGLFVMLHLNPTNGWAF